MTKKWGNRDLQSTVHPCSSVSGVLEIEYDAEEKISKIMQLSTCLLQTIKQPTFLGITQGLCGSA